MVSTDKERYAAAAQEDRSAPRSKIAIPATLRPSGSKSFQTVLRDLSLAGFAATAISRVHPGTYCWLTMPGMESMAAKTVWWEGGLVGCAFEQLLNPIVLENILARWRGEHG